MINLYTTFEVSTCTRYEAMNGVQNAENGVVWGGYGVGLIPVEFS